MSLSSPMDQGFADRALLLLRRWPALTVRGAEHGPGTALALRNRQIVHFHGHDEAEVYLTRSVVRRMADPLEECGHAAVDPDGEWVRVRLGSPTDVGFLVSLVSVAIKANVTAARTRNARSAPCPRAGVPSL